MNASDVVELSRRTIEAAFWVAMPILLSAMVVGLIINIGQVMTSIQDMTVSTVPRLTAVGCIIFFLTPCFPIFDCIPSKGTHACPSICRQFCLTLSLLACASRV
jgi:flagellar biosynthetic protein FliQ